MQLSEHSFQFIGTANPFPQRLSLDHKATSLQFPLCLVPYRMASAHQTFETDMVLLSWVWNQPAWPVPIGHWRLTWSCSLRSGTIEHGQCPSGIGNWHGSALLGLEHPVRHQLLAHESWFYFLWYTLLSQSLHLQFSNSV